MSSNRNNNRCIHLLNSEQNHLLYPRFWSLDSKDFVSIFHTFNGVGDCWLRGSSFGPADLKQRDFFFYHKPNSKMTSPRWPPSYYKFWGDSYTGPFCHTTCKNRAFPPVWILTWTMRFERCVNAFLQNGYLCGLSPMWILKCAARWSLQTNALSQSEHLKAFSPMWFSSMCLIRSESLSNCSPQTRQAFVSFWASSCSIKTMSMRLWPQDNQQSIPFLSSFNVTVMLLKVVSRWQSVWVVVSESVSLTLT